MSKIQMKRSHYFMTYIGLPYSLVPLKQVSVAPYLIQEGLVIIGNKLPLPLKDELDGNAFGKCCVRKPVAAVHFLDLAPGPAEGVDWLTLTGQLVLRTHSVIPIDF